MATNGSQAVFISQTLKNFSNLCSLWLSWLYPPLAGRTFGSMHIFTQLFFFPIVIGDVGGAVVETAEGAAAAAAAAGAVALHIIADVVAAITVHVVVVVAATVLVLTEAV